MPTIDRTKDGRTVILRLREEESWDLTTALDEFLEEGCRQFVVDLDGHDFLNSVKIASIIQYHHQVEAVGGQMRVANLEPRMRQIFQVLKLERLFALDQSLDDALAGFPS